MPQQVILVGYRACGKSSVAAKLATELQWPLIDLDRAIEQASGQTIPQLFAQVGERGFRVLEQAQLQQAVQQPGPWIMATGGGVVIDPHNRTLLQDSAALVVYLQASAELLASRLRQQVGQRPSLTGAHPADEVAELLAQREPWYTAVADVCIAASQPLSQVVAALRQACTQRSVQSD